MLSPSTWSSIGGVSATCTNGYSVRPTWTANAQQAAPAKPAAEVKFDSIKPIVTGTNGTLTISGKNLDTYSDVTIGGKPAALTSSTDTGVSFKSVDLAPGAYDIVLKTGGSGSLTIQGGYIVAPKPEAVTTTSNTPAIAPVRGLTSTEGVTGFGSNPKVLSASQKSDLQNLVVANEAKTLECVGTSSAKISAAVAKARATALCAYAARLNPNLVTTVSVTSGQTSPVVINYTR